AIQSGILAPLRRRHPGRGQPHADHRRPRVGVGHLFRAGPGRRRAKCTGSGSGRNADRPDRHPLTTRRRKMDMPASPPLDSNQADLVARIGELKTFLARRAKTPPEASPPRIGPAPAPADASASLRRLEQAFGLSPFERDTLLLCAGMEIDGEIPGLCATAQGDAARAYPTFALALAVLPGAHWSALSPEAPLRHWRLIEVGAGPVLTQAPLRIDERVLHFLVGVGHLDARLAALLVAIPPTDRQGLVPSQAAIAEQIAQIWSGAASGGELPVMQLRGVAPDCRPIAAAAAGLLGLGAVSLMAERLPSSPAELESLLRLWEREAVLSGTGVLF